ncbi:XRE family transcriptional regulator [Oceanibaculum indicum]|uniref:DNA-binding protein n=1 Tax=Oceanibaculum indicum TaxID=526216 RepID=A0A420WNB6_9PROT|nr:XRE family transcriptional regulator [Oceanibaculum indicum]RKQ72499.1 hypothetical protein BCL74_0266 [Oceanibaculum indicum]
MTYDEFLRHVGKAGLTLKAFAEVVRMNRISLSNLAKKGEVPTHLAIIAALLGEMADHGIDYRGVFARIEITPKKPRGAGKLGKFGGDKQEDLFVDGLAPKRTGEKALHGANVEQRLRTK